MNPFLPAWTLSFRHPCISRKYFGLLYFCCLLCLNPVHAQEKCNTCSIPSFPALTLYHALQTGSAMGVGIEAGKWKKDAGRFSYFLGTEMLLTDSKEEDPKTPRGSRELIFSFYWKGQYKIANHFYLVGQPELVNLSFFEMRTGIRYVIPITKIIGVGLEPGYSLVRKQWSLNTNIHFALL